VNYTIVGDTVNVAQRLETLGHKLDDGDDVTVLMSAQTARLAGLGGEGEDVGEHVLAGVPQRVSVVRLTTHLMTTVPNPSAPPIPAK
jgi:adenylate cyclase